MRAKKYTSTKTYNNIAPCAYRQWRAESHCNIIHGYALSFHFEFESDTLDVRNWVMDYGGLHPLKEQLEDWFDHTLLLATDDPMYDEIKRLGLLGLAKITEVEATGCEAIAEFLYEWVNTVFIPNYGEKDRVWCSRIEVRETPNNMAYVSGHQEDGEFNE